VAPFEPGLTPEAQQVCADRSTDDRPERSCREVWNGSNERSGSRVPGTGGVPRA
jgi:hypothetical protein